MPWKRTLSWSLSVQVPKRSVLVAAATALAEALVALDEVALPAALPVAAEVLVLTLVAGVAAVLVVAAGLDAVPDGVAETGAATPQAASKGSATVMAPTSRNTSRRGNGWADIRAPRTDFIGDPPSPRTTTPYFG